MAFQYASWIETYFPPSQWANATCISMQECPPTQADYPGSCVQDQGAIRCGTVEGAARSYGIFGLLDVCWDPARNPDSPFTPAQWAARMDPNVNTWMASIIWSRHGWRAFTTCTACGNCGVTGLPIPYPRGPVGAPVPPEGVPTGGLGLVLGLGAIAGALVFIGYHERKARRYA